MIKYTESLEGITTAQLDGFFVGWGKPPTPETHLKLLGGSDHVVLAIDDARGIVIGFITAITDGVLSAYLPLLEVLPEYKGQGIGTELTRRILAKLGRLYMIDLICDEDLKPFYERFEMKPFSAMVIRDYDRQSGA